MYLSNKLFRTSQPPLNLSDSTTQQDTQVSFYSLLRNHLVFSSLLQLRVPHPLLSFSLPTQGPQITVTAESAIPRDATGAIDHKALVELLKGMQSLQDQADILYILFKDKWDDCHLVLWLISDIWLITNVPHTCWNVKVKFSLGFVWDAICEYI